MSIRITPRTTRLWALPAKQARSRETRHRLLLAGRQLLDQGVFEQTPIARLAQIAGCSVGSFYSRFPDKEAFYQAVMAAYRGLTSTVQHKSMRDKPANQPLQRIGLRTVDHARAPIDAKYGEQGNPLFKRNIEVVPDGLLGPMMGLLNAPPVLNENSPDYRFWIKEVVTHPLGVRAVPVEQSAHRARVSATGAVRGASVLAG